MAKTKPFRGFCLGQPKPQDREVFTRLVCEVLPAHECNTLVLLTRYRYQFQSHPAAADPGGFDAEEAREFARRARDAGVRVIPKMNLFGHQSEKKKGSEQGLLRAYPQFDETPELEDVRYCRSLCPSHPDVKRVVFDLADELVDAFEADAIHIGLDEVFEIGTCPRCRESKPHEIFGTWVGALRDHFVDEKGLEVLMWGDRLLDAEATGYGEWEASTNGTAAAVDDVAKDVLICDWHYGVRGAYPSVAAFTEKGFRMVVCPWKNVAATQAFLVSAFAKPNDRLLGTLATSWCNSGEVAKYLVEGDQTVGETAQLAGESFKRAMELTP